MKKVIKALRLYREKPLAFVEDIIGATPTHQQREILLSVERMLKGDKKRMAIKSGHGTGKSALASWLVLWFLTLRPHSIVVCTAPTFHQLHDVLWKEIAIWRKKMKLGYILEQTATEIKVKGHEKTWFAVARTPSTPEGIQGFHAEDLLIVVDEASGVKQEILEALLGALTKNENYLFMIGNPTQISGAFYDAFHRDREFYITHTLSSEESHLVDRQWLEQMRRKYGPESDVYRVRVLGEFPRAEPDVFIPLHIVERAVYNEVETGEPMEIGIDPARFGDDQTAIVVRAGMKVTEILKFHGIDTVRTTGEVVRLVRKYNPSVIKVDDTGIGAGVTDQLRDVLKGSVKVVGVNFGGKPRDSRNYANIAAEMWGILKELFENGEIQIPNDDELIAQLTTRRYTIDRLGRIQLEKKEEMKKRGLPSPDIADALALAFYPATLGIVASGKRAMKGWW